MSLANKRFLYSIHSIAPYDPLTGNFYGNAKVLGEVSLNFSGELVELYGGASKTPWKVEDGKIKAEVQMKIKEYPAWVWQLFQGATPTITTNDPGSITTPVNKHGSSMVSAGGIASIVMIPSTGGPNMKLGRYLIKAVSATTFDVYASSDINFTRGLAGALQDDLLKITPSPLTLTAGANTDLATYGLRFVGDTGPIALSVGDTCVFDVRPPSSSLMTVKVGGVNDLYPEFGILIYGKQLGSRDITEIDVFKAKGVGLPLQFSENAFSQSEMKLTAFYDAIKDGVYNLTNIVPA